MGEPELDQGNHRWVNGRALPSGCLESRCVEEPCMTPNPRDGTGRFHSGLAPLFRGRGYLWRKFEGWTLAAGVIIVAAIVLMKLNQLEPVATQPGESLV